MFQIPRSLYYLIVTVYLGIMAAFYAVLNSTVTDEMSDVYLGLSVVSGLLAFFSIGYWFTARKGQDDDADSEVVSGLPFGKAYYYLGVFAISLIRCGVSYLANKHSTGLESIWSYLWIIASLIVIALTWGNWQTYRRTHPDAIGGVRPAGTGPLHAQSPASTPINRSAAQPTDFTNRR